MNQRGLKSWHEPTMSGNRQQSWHKPTMSLNMKKIKRNKNTIIKRKQTRAQQQMDDNRLNWKREDTILLKQLGMFLTRPVKKTVKLDFLMLEDILNHVERNGIGLENLFGGHLQF